MKVDIYVEVFDGVVNDVSAFEANSGKAEMAFEKDTHMPFLKYINKRTHGAETEILGHHTGSNIYQCEVS